MEYELVDLSQYELSVDKEYVIFGAGKAGRLLFHYVHDVKGIDLCCCDGNIMLASKCGNPRIILTDEAVDSGNTYFLIGFMEDDRDKHLSAISTLQDFGIDKSHMIHVSINDFIESEVFAHDLKAFIDSNPPTTPGKLDKIKGICFLAHAFIRENEANPTGGPIGAEIMQKRILGQSFCEKKLYFPYFNPIKVYFNTDKFFVFIDAIFQAMQLASNVDDVVYLANDIFSAYGLYLAGARYLLLFHAQGDFIKERIYWGSVISDEEYSLLIDIEKKAFEHAYKVCFPSKGAQQYFIKDIENGFRFDAGKPLYNSIYEYPEPVPFSNVERDSSRLTFFSIGQMTDLKGIDRIPGFLKRVSALTKKKIRWICVADGPLKERVREDVQSLFDKDEVEYINIDHKIPHDEIFGLMEIADIYVMLQRVSIFDFSTLEAMYFAKAIVLSDIHGNDEFNVDNNILLYKENTTDAEIADLLNSIDRYGEKNKKAYEDCFDAQCFKDRYYNCLKEFCDAVENE